MLVSTILYGLFLFHLNIVLLNYVNLLEPTSSGEIHIKWGYIKIFLYIYKDINFLNKLLGKIHFTNNIKLGGTKKTK